MSDGNQQLPLVSAAEMRVFESLSHLLDPNPRRLKRIISVYALVAEVAKRVPLSQDADSKARVVVEMCHAVQAKGVRPIHLSQRRSPRYLTPSREPALQLVGDDPKWAEFRPKLAKWLCLCENYPYRMSFLVLIITDRVQKELVNRLSSTHPSRKLPSSRNYGLVYYDNDNDADAVDSLELPEDMPIVQAYFQHVERYIYSHPKARKLLSLDGDPVCAPLKVSRLVPAAGGCTLLVCSPPCACCRSCLPHCSSPR